MVKDAMESVYTVIEGVRHLQFKLYFLMPSPESLWGQFTVLRLQPGDPIYGRCRCDLLYYCDNQSFDLLNTSCESPDP